MVIITVMTTIAITKMMTTQKIDIYSVKCTVRVNFNRFQWSVFLYLVSIIPSVWILELQKIKRFESALENQTHLSFEIQTVSFLPFCF